MTRTSDDAFRILARPSTGADRVRIRESGTTVTAGAVAHAIDATGHRLLVIPLTDDQNDIEDVQSKGFAVHTRRLVDGDVERRYLVVQCETRELAATFSALCDDLLEHLAHDPADPGATCLVVLDQWRELFDPVTQGLLTAGALLGLLVEIRFLEQVCVTVGAETALRIWTGPPGGRQDFTRRTTAVEVKGSSGRDRVLIEIHGLGQMDGPETGRLFLWVERMERVAEGGDSVPDALDRLITLGVSELRVLKTLAPLGYSATDREKYRSLRYSSIETMAYEVGAGFPRLVPSSLVDPSLAERLSAVRYTIDLSDSSGTPGRLGDPSAVLAALAADDDA